MQLSMFFESENVENKSSVNFILKYAFRKLCYLLLQLFLAIFFFVIYILYKSSILIALLFKIITLT